MRDVEAVWRPLFARAGHRFEAAEVRDMTSREDDGICAPPEETTDLLGLYCDGERRIFLLAPEPTVNWRYVVAHEVGHHVQGLRGTLDATRDELDDHPGAVEDLHLREELQADCYAGVWGRAAGLPPPADTFHQQPVDEPGTPTQRRRWLMRGWRSGRPALCDTFSPRRP